jgi:hypothetical protein
MSRRRSGSSGQGVHIRLKFDLSNSVSATNRK